MSEGRRSVLSPWNVHRAARAIVLGLSMAVAACASDLREDDVGDAAVCEPARQWPVSLAEAEDELLYAVAQRRTRGGRCGNTARAPQPALDVSPEMKCAARLHAIDLAEAGRITHEGVDGSTPQQRLQRAGSMYVPVHELLAADYEDPADVLAAWLAELETCNALHDPSLDALGLGHAVSRSGENTAWVLVTGRIPE